MRLFGKPKQPEALDDEDVQLLRRELSREEVRELEQAIDREIKNPPHLAFIGLAGVGKTKTMNVLFGTREKESDVQAGTTIATHHNVQVQGVKGKRGVIRVTDMPGLGESNRVESKYLDMYVKALASVDAALWVMDARERQFLAVQQYLNYFRTSLANEVFARFVVGMNKVETIQPGHWNERTNGPDRSQRQSIAERQLQVVQELQIEPSRIVFYSAAKSYRLDELLTALLEAVPPKRRLALDARASLSDPTTMMSSKYRELTNELLHSN